MNPRFARAKMVWMARQDGQSLAAIGRSLGITKSRASQLAWKGCELIERERSNEPIGELSTRLRNIIDALGCSPAPAAVAKQFQQFSPKEILRIPNLGAGSRNELRDWLKRHGQQPW